MGQTKLDSEMKWYWQERAKTVVANMQRKRLNALYAANKKEALEAVIALVPPGSSIVRGDSISMNQVGIIEELRKRGFKVIDPFERDARGDYIIKKPEDRFAAARAAFTADVFLVGSNAITQDGMLVNVDGWGNRVAPMIFGPKKVIVLAGVNKIVKDLDEALERISQYAAPINARRHATTLKLQEYGDLPCVRTGKCVHCNHDLCICHFTTIIDGVMESEKGRINVVLVGEELGI